MSQSFFTNQEKFLSDYLSVSKVDTATLDENELYVSVLDQLVSGDHHNFRLGKEETKDGLAVQFQFDHSVGINVEGDNGNVETLWQYLDMKIV